MAYYTYILRCTDGSLYTGMTTDLERRFDEHLGKNGRGAKYTALRRPLRIEAAWAAQSRSAAASLECRIKRLKKPDKERLVLGETPAGLELSSYVRLEPPACGD